MPSGLRRYYGAYDLHFITSSCYDRRPYLTPERRDLVLQMLEDARKKYRFVVVGYVVMPEHFHLLMSEPEISDPSFVIKSVKYRVSRKVLVECRSHTSRPGVPKTEDAARRDVWGTQITSERFWQHRFYDFNVFTEKKRVEKLNYIHANPVERGLVFRPEDWRWSSYGYYASGEEGPVKLNVGWPKVSQICPK